MISIGLVLGEPEQERSAIDTAITAAMQAAIKFRSSFGIGTSLGVNIVFHVPGRLLAPDWEGLRVERFSRKRQLVLVSVAVPKALLSSDGIQDFVIDALREASSLAFETFHKKGIEFPMADAEALVDQIEKELVKN